MIAGMIMAVLLPMLMAAAFLFGRHLQRRQQQAAQISPVTRQHIDLFQGGQLHEATLEAAKRRLRELLERGEVATVEASLRPGTQYVFHVRALTEIGTEDAGKILERQLQRRLTSDQLEQSWYWIDLANGLRSLNRVESLPHLLRCAEAAGEIPLGHFFAAETVCFLGFAGYLRQLDSPLGRSALRLLHHAVEGLRYGVLPLVVAEARLGEMIEDLWDHRPSEVNPVLVRVFAETLRFLDRAPHARAALADERAEQEAFEWQLSRLIALEPALRDYLDEARRYLCARLGKAQGTQLTDVLQALNDLRAEAGLEVLALLQRPDAPCRGLAVEVLTWSRDPQVAPWLRSWVSQHVPMVRRAQWRPRPSRPRRTSISPKIPYAAVLRTLRCHASPETEAFLVLAARDWDPLYRAAALSSLGWWEPICPRQVLPCLKRARRDPNPEVRHAARAALARLGERQALHWFHEALVNKDPHVVHDTIQAVATEGLTLLWPDLDHLTDSEDADIVSHAREALEQLREDMDYRRS
jgi:hypothetical protein